MLVGWKNDDGADYTGALSTSKQQIASSTILLLYDAAVLRRIANFLSLAGHPFVLMPPVLLLVARHSMSASSSLAFASIITLCTIVPLMVMIIVKTRRGEWTNFDVSVRRDRPLLYLMAIVLTTAVGFILKWRHFAPGMARGSFGAAAMLTVAALINLRLKVSLHSAFIMYFGCSLLTLDRTAALILLIAAPLIGASRVILRRHTPAEVVTGLLLGGIAGCAVAFL